MGMIGQMQLGAAALAVACASVLAAGRLHAQDAADPQPSAAPQTDPKTERARELFLHGVELVQAARWGEALSAFESSSAQRPHPVTTFNIGACQRAMGHYTRARRTLRRALREQTAELRLPDNLASDAQGFLAQIDTTLARVRVTLVPPGAAVSIDGRPLELEANEGEVPVMVAGIRAPGPGSVPRRATFELVMDPGVHVLTISRKGFNDVVVNRTFSSGRQQPLRLELEKLPAVLRVSANVADALVRVNDDDLGPVPVDVRRPAGTHRVTVRKSGYDDYETVVTVGAGEQADLKARLTFESVPLTKRWWFWAGAGVVVVGGAFLTYALTRPDPEPPPYDGGSTGWVVRPAGVTF